MAGEGEGGTLTDLRYLYNIPMAFVKHQFPGADHHSPTATGGACYGP